MEKRQCGHGKSFSCRGTDLTNGLRSAGQHYSNFGSPLLNLKLFSLFFIGSFQHAKKGKIKSFGYAYDDEINRKMELVPLKNGHGVVPPLLWEINRFAMGGEQLNGGLARHKTEGMHREKALENGNHFQHASMVDYFLTKVLFDFP